MEGTAGMAEPIPRMRLVQDSAWRHDLQLLLPGLVTSGVQEALRTLAPRVELLELRFDRLDAIVDGISNSHEFDIAPDGDQQLKMAALAVGESTGQYTAAKCNGACNRSGAHRGRQGC